MLKAIPKTCGRWMNSRGTPVPRAWRSLEKRSRRSGFVDSPTWNGISRRAAEVVAEVVDLCRMPLRSFAQAARVLLIDDQDRVLLLRANVGAGDVWITPGGGVEPGETAED